VTLRFGEPVTEGFEHVFHGEPLYSGRSEFQKIDVYHHDHFGKILTLDDLIQTTEYDEFCYHEMLVHPALSSRTSVERVLIIGGGDGGTLRHVLMHSPSEAVMCEIDGEVVRVCRELMPGLSDGAFEDPRTTLVIGDGAAYVAGCSDEFDAILVDSTDPIGAATVLFSDEFYRSCERALKPGGVFVSQTGSPMYQGKEFTSALERMRGAFASVETYLGFVPTYPGVLWSFTAGTSGAPMSSARRDDIATRLAERDVPARFYTPDVHVSSFALPTFVRDIVETTSGAPEAQRSAG
jgi:spermidine synthase